MRPLATFARLGFVFQSLLGIVTLAIAPSMVAMSLHQGPLHIAATALAGILLFGSLNLIPAIACFAFHKGMRSARAWAIAASLIDILWTPLVAQCTESGAVLLALIGISGLAAFLRRPPLERSPAPALSHSGDFEHRSSEKRASEPSGFVLPTPPHTTISPTPNPSHTPPKYFFLPPVHQLTDPSQNSRRPIP
jgi:hypothetical protein